MRGIETRLKAIEDRLPKSTDPILIIIREISTREKADTPETPEQKAALAAHLTAHPWKPGENCRVLTMRGVVVTEDAPSEKTA